MGTFSHNWCVLFLSVLTPEEETLFCLVNNFEFLVCPQTTLNYSYLLKSYKIMVTGLSKNTFCMGNKSLVQRGFFKISVSDLLPALRFLSKLYNICNFVSFVFFNKSQWYEEVVTYFTDLEMIEYYQKTCGWNRSLWKLNGYLMVYIRMYGCYENIKIKFWSTISILKP